MRFQILDIVPYVQNPVTGRLVSPAERLDQTVEFARRAERLGFDAFAVGERHAGHFLSSSPTVLLGAIAAVTSTHPPADRRDRALGARPGAGRRGLRDHRPALARPARAHDRQGQRGGAVPAVRARDRRPVGAPRRPLRAAAPALARDRGRLGRRRRTRARSAARRHCRGRTPARRGCGTARRRRSRRPRSPHAGATRCSARTRSSRSRNYAVLVQHYRDEYARHGHDPRFAYVGAGAGALFIADTTQQARDLYGPVYEALVAATNVPGNNSPFRDIDHAIAEGPALVGSPQQVIDKIGRFHERVRARPAVDQPADDPAGRAAGRAASSASPPRSRPSRAASSRARSGGRATRTRCVRRSAAVSRRMPRRSSSRRPRPADRLAAGVPEATR